jgi:hypothetical protein
MQEMFRQGDRERAADFPVSPLMDRHKTGITKSQVRGGMRLVQIKVTQVTRLLLLLIACLLAALTTVEMKLIPLFVFFAARLLQRGGPSDVYRFRSGFPRCSTAACRGA